MSNMHALSAEFCYCCVMSLFVFILMAAAQIFYSVFVEGRSLDTEGAPSKQLRKNVILVYTFIASDVNKFV